MPESNKAVEPQFLYHLNKKEIRKDTHLEDLGVDETIILKFVVRMRMRITMRI
jgi:hypothetical protein